MPTTCKMHHAVALSCLFLLPATHSLPPPPRRELMTAAARQGVPPLDAVLTGLISPPLIVVMGMSALFYTFEKFAKDVVKAASQRGRLRKKKPTTKPSSPPPQTASFKREHRKFIRSLERVVVSGQFALER